MEWKEAVNTDAILLADRAIGDGNDLSARSSVWTDPGSGRWRGSVVRNNGSTEFLDAPEAVDLHYGESTFRVDAPLIDNLFSNTFKLEADGDDGTRITPTSGVLYDEADSGTDPDAF